MLCQQCNATLAEGANFCHVCGAKQDKKNLCSACGQELIAGAKFCFNCGAAVDAVPAKKIASTAASASVAKSQPFAPVKSDEPFFKTWIAEHKDDAERLEIEWISKFKGKYAVAILKNKSYAVVRSSDTEIALAYSSSDKFAEFAVVGKDCDSVLGNDCFGNGYKTAVWVTSGINRNSETDEYISIIESLTGKKKRVTIREDLYTLCLAFDYNGNILHSKQSGGYLSADCAGAVLSNDHFLMLDADDYDASGNDAGKKLQYSIYNSDGTLYMPQVYFRNTFFKQYSGLVCFSVTQYIDNKQSVKDSVYNCNTGRLYTADEKNYYEMWFSTVWEDNILKNEIWYILKHSDVFADPSSEYVDWNGEKHIDQTFVPVIIDLQDVEVATLDRSIELQSMVESEDYIYICANIWQKDSDEYKNGLYSIHKGYKSYRPGCKITNESLGLDKIVEIPGAMFVVGSIGSELALFNEELKIVNKIPNEHYESSYYVVKDDIYSVYQEKDNIGRINQVVTNVNTGGSFRIPIDNNRKLVINAKGDPAEDGGRGLHSEGNDDFEYSLGSITAFGEPYFLVGNERELNSYYICQGGCGLVDKHGRWIIPYSEDILFITQRDYLPANTFYVCCFDNIRKVYDSNGTLIAQGKFDNDGEINELRDNYDACKTR